MAANRLDAKLTDEQVRAVTDAVAEIRSNLPFLLDLSPRERQRVPKFNDDQGFVRRALEVAQQNPDILRRTFDTEAMARDLALADALDPVRIALNQLAELVDDTHMQARSEAFVAALKVLDAVQDAEGEGLDEVAEELARRFRRPSREREP